MKKLDLTKMQELSYSCIMRELNKKCSEEEINFFLKTFKEYFDQALKNDLESPDKIALQKSLIAFNKKIPIKLSKELVKNAAVAELGNANLVGKYLSDIIKFTLNKIPADKKYKYINKVKTKLNSLNENDLANKEMPDSASIGQSITFVKHVLFNQNPSYIRSVVNEIVSNL